MILRLMNRQLTLLKKEAQKTYPAEACALLFGKLNEKEVIVEKVVVTPNILRSAVRFAIDSKAFYDAFTAAAKDGLEFVGFFHSHPAPADPSSVDLEFMRLWSDAVWLIYSSTDNNFGAFQMRKGKVQSAELQTKRKLKE